MQVGVEQSANGLVIAPSGRLDGANASMFERQCNTEIEKDEGNVLLDLSELEYVSSAGLRVILTIAKSLKSQARTFKVCSVPANVSEVFRISGFSQILDIVENRASASD